MINEKKLREDMDRADKLGIPWFQFGEGARLLDAHNMSVPTGCGVTEDHQPATCPWCQPAPSKKRKRSR